MAAKGWIKASMQVPQGNMTLMTPNLGGNFLMERQDQDTKSLCAKFEVHSAPIQL